MHLSVGQKAFGLLAGITVLLLLARPLAYLGVHALESTLPNRYLKLSDSKAGYTNVTYDFGFDTLGTSNVGSVELELCTNDPFPGTSCTVPVGLDVSSAVLLSQSGTNDFAIDAGGTNAHKIVFSRAPSSVGPTSFRFEFDSVTNPDDPGPVYGRIRTFTGINSTGTLVDEAGLAIMINGDLTVSTEVPPHIDLCVGTTVALDCTATFGEGADFGDLSPTSTAAVTTQFASATNAENGYTVTISGGSMTSGNNVITPLTIMSVAIPGANQFGMNLRANIAPNIGAEPSGSGTAVPVGSYAIPDNYTFDNGDVIVSAAGPDNFKKFTATYILNINRDQPGGYYATTITYIALGNF